MYNLPIYSMCSKYIYIYAEVNKRNVYKVKKVMSKLCINNKYITCIIFPVELYEPILHIVL